MSVHKKFQPNRSSRLADYREHIYEWTLRIHLIPMRHVYGVPFLNKRVKSFVKFHQLFQSAEETFFSLKYINIILWVKKLKAVKDPYLPCLLFTFGKMFPFYSNSDDITATTLSPRISSNFVFTQVFSSLFYLVRVNPCPLAPDTDTPTPTRPSPRSVRTWPRIIETRLKTKTIN